MANAFQTINSLQYLWFEMELLILAFISEWVIASFSKDNLISFSDDVLIIKVKYVLYKAIKTIGK